jgi:hypothetical protein
MPLSQSLPFVVPVFSILIPHILPQVSEAEVDKKGDGYVLKSDPSVRVHARAHKMSKSRGNVINPDDVVQEFGGDSLRLYEMFMGPLRDTKVITSIASDCVTSDCITFTCVARSSTV